MIYLKSYVLDRIRHYKGLLRIINNQLDKCFSIKQYDKLQFQRKTYTIILQELDMILALLEEV